ncbi:MAG: hypothetical protein NXI22_20440, partial [bacterium]|nr:hypothetical protein [bacterium]
VNLYNPVDFDPAATHLVELGLRAAEPTREVNCSRSNVETLLLDNPQGTLLTLVNWTNDDTVGGLQISVRMPSDVKEVFSVVQQKTLPSRYENGRLRFTTDLQAADYIMLKK